MCVLLYRTAAGHYAVHAATTAAAEQLDAAAGWLMFADLLIIIIAGSPVHRWQLAERGILLPDTGIQAQRMRPGCMWKRFDRALSGACMLAKEWTVIADFDRSLCVIQ
jgi:hypothetical protein